MNRLIKDSIIKSNEMEKKENEEYEKEMLKFAREIFGEEYLDCLECTGLGELKIVDTDFKLFYSDNQNCFFLQHPNVTEIIFGPSIRSLEDLGNTIKYFQNKIDDSKIKSRFHSIKRILGIEK